MSDFRIEWQTHSQPGIRVLNLRGPFTIETIADFQAMTSDPSDLLTVIDLSEVSYMDSGAMGSLLGLHLSCQRDKRQYVLIGVSERLQSVFHVMGVDGVFTVCESLEQAAALAKKTAPA